MEKSKTVKEYKKQIVITYAAVIGIMVLGILAAIIINNQYIPEPNQIYDKIFAYLVPAFFIITTLAAYLYFNNKIRDIKNEDLLANKLEKYKELYIIKLGLFSGTGLFAILAYLVTANIVHIIVLGLTFMLFALNRFSTKILYEQLGLDEDEQNTVNNDTSDITPSLERTYMQRNPWIVIIMMLFFLYLIYDGLKDLI